MAYINEDELTQITSDIKQLVTVMENSLVDVNNTPSIVAFTVGRASLVISDLVDRIEDIIIKEQ